jgi:opacity protein-like surface antigen
MHRPVLFAVLFALAMGSATAANLVAFQAFARLESLGYGRRWWKMKDFRLYRLYWQLAPRHGWPRWPLATAFATFFACGAAFILAILWQ